MNIGRRGCVDVRAMARLVLALAPVALALGCFQAAQECRGSCVSLGDYCARVPEIAGCGQLKACGWAPPDASCDEVPWRDRYVPVELPCSPALLEAIDAGRVDFDSAAAGRCLASAQRSCRWMPAGCDLVFSGSLDEGASCRTLHECRRGLWCDQSAGCPGTCRPQSALGSQTPSPELACVKPYWSAADGGRFRCENPGPVGASCEQSFKVCTDGLWCRPTPDGGICSDARAGASCDGSATGFCDWTFTCTNQNGEGRCSPWAGSGERCSSSESSWPALPEFPRCRLNLACRTDGGTNGVCGLPLRSSEECLPSPSLDVCASNLRCALDAGRCRERGAQGQPCASFASLLANSPGFNLRRDCVDGLVCVDGACRQPGLEGARCDPQTLERNDGCAEELVCLLGKCVPPKCDL